MPVISVPSNLDASLIDKWCFPTQSLSPTFMHFVCLYAFLFPVLNQISEFFFRAKHYFTRISSKILRRIMFNKWSIVRLILLLFDTKLRKALLNQIRQQAKIMLNTENMFFCTQYHSRVIFDFYEVWVYSNNSILNTFL